MSFSRLEYEIKHHSFDTVRPTEEFSVKDIVNKEHVMDQSCAAPQQDSTVPTILVNLQKCL